MTPPLSVYDSGREGEQMSAVSSLNPAFLSLAFACHERSRDLSMAPRYDGEENESRRFSREERVSKIRSTLFSGLKKQLKGKYLNYDICPAPICAPSAPTFYPMCGPLSNLVPTLACVRVLFCAWPVTTHLQLSI
jgi:hypothetical protein